MFVCCPICFSNTCAGIERTQNNFGAGGGAHATVVLESLNTVMALNVALEVELQNESLLPVYLGLVCCLRGVVYIVSRFS